MNWIEHLDDTERSQLRGLGERLQHHQEMLDAMRVQITRLRKRAEKRRQAAQKARKEDQ